MRLGGRVLISVVGVVILWLAVTMAISPALIVPVPSHGEAPGRIVFERTVVTEVSRYVAAALLGFFGLTLVVAPWRKRRQPSGSSGDRTANWG